jgi:hypothetical protein
MFRRTLPPAENFAKKVSISFLLLQTIVNETAFPFFSPSGPSMPAFLRLAWRIFLWASAGIRLAIGDFSGYGGSASPRERVIGFYDDRRRREVCRWWCALR